MDTPLIMEVLALSYLELLVPIRSICLLQRHCEVTFVPAGTSITRALQHRGTHTHTPPMVPGARGHLLVTAMLISPDLGVSSPSCGSCDMPEVRRGSRLRELSVPKSPSAERLLGGCPRVSRSMSKATLSVHGTLGWGNTAPRYTGECSAGSTHLH